MPRHPQAEKSMLIRRLLKKLLRSPENQLLSNNGLSIKLGFRFGGKKLSDSIIAFHRAVLQPIRPDYVIGIDGRKYPARQPRPRVRAWAVVQHVGRRRSSRWSVGA